MSFEFKFTDEVTYVKGVGPRRAALLEKLNIFTKLAIITTEEWKSSAQEFMNKRKNNVSYELIEEPKLMFVKSKKNEKKVNNDSILERFSDILEVK